jgi:glycosyltransferase involved in cell wall biosynthesis
MQSAGNLPLIIDVANGAVPGSFVSRHFVRQTHWEFFSTSQSVGLLDFVKKPDVRQWAACYRAARYAVAHDAALVITHGPHIAYRTGLFLDLLGYQGKHLSLFNYSWLPHGIMRHIHTVGFRGVNKFVVFSTMEKMLYSDYFGLSPEKLEFVRWGTNPPLVEPADRAIEAGEYICAIGGNSRDYATLLKAMELLPKIRLVIVARPENLRKLSIPRNVSVHTNIPFAAAMNILAFSRFMVVPLIHKKIPCGHVTIVNAMHLGKAFIITNSSGVEDYAQHGFNALTCQEKCPEDLAQAIEKLWNDRPMCQRLADNGLGMARDYCTEKATFTYFAELLKRLGVLTSNLVERDRINE